MEKFYGDRIDDIDCEYLLKATPFASEPRINFGGHLKIEYFLKHMYAEKQRYIEERINLENDRFEQDFDNLLEIIDNRFAKVDLIHIAGYAGCGKTTFVRTKLYELEKKKKFKFEIVDFERKRKIDTPTENNLGIQIIRKKDNLIRLTNFLKDISEGRKFNFDVFKSIDRYITIFINNINKYKKNNANLNLENTKKIFYNLKKEIVNENTYYYFLLVLSFLLQIFDRFETDSSIPMIIFFDNVDSIDNLLEEEKLVSVLVEFMNNCNFFIGENLDNEQMFNHKKISDVFAGTKFIFILTTRNKTEKKYLELVPDLEKMYGWNSLKMPEYFFDHSCIIKKRIECYEKLEEGTHSIVMDQLHRIQKLVNIFYKNSNFKKLFNGNIRFCIDILCKLALDNRNKMLLAEMEKLQNIPECLQEINEGENGFMLNLVFNYFQDNEIYDKKLHLSECQGNNELSLSRLVLTVLREKGGFCSILDLFKIFDKTGYSLDDICTVIWDLNEAKRNIWRRLLIFSFRIPDSVEELFEQVKQYKNDNYDISHYSEITICTAGLVYLEQIVPHFEFMFSRSHYELSKNINVNYQPLFASGSEEVIGSSVADKKYRFEKKIDIVLQNVKDCCLNSYCFGERIIENNDFKMTKEEYINNSFFNYHTVNRDGTYGQKQSYESRLIFSHIGYIERYRRYLLKKRKDLSIEIRSEISKKIISRINQYLDLYRNPKVCFQTEAQNEALKLLEEKIRIIEKSHYYDFETRIEINN